MARSPRNVSDAVRERETFKQALTPMLPSTYDSVLIGNTIRSSTGGCAPIENLKSCSDASLIAYAQLAALRLNVKRALISLFDRQYQYVVAEATPALPLTPSLASQEMAQRELWLCGTAIPRPAGICSRILVDAEVGQVIAPGGLSHRPGDLPVTIVPDITADPRTADSLYSQGWPENRFYAGVPIRTRRGIDIGMLCILDDSPRHGLDELSIRLMRDLSTTIMSRFEARRSAAGYKRADRMVRGLGSFVEGQATLSGWQEDNAAESEEADPAVEGSLNQNQQQLRDRTHASQVTSPLEAPTVSPFFPGGGVKDVAYRAATHHPQHDHQTSPSASLSPLASQDLPMDIEHVFSKSANIIRESIEVEGVLFLDASIGSFGGMAAAKAGPHTHTSSSSSSSASDDDGNRTDNSSDASDQAGPADDVMCDILGFSTSTSSSIDGNARLQTHAMIPEKLLTKLLRRYPQGRIFNFDESGSMQSSDFSGDDVLSPEATNLSSSTSTSRPNQSQRHGKHSVNRRFKRHNEGKLIAGMFPGARSVVLIPVWDAQRERWYAGGFAYTKTPTRVFTIEGELSYLRAFGWVIMSEVARVKAISVDRAKTDLLSSLSHELRSPLHGVVLGVELLQDTALDAFQGDVLHSVETCGRTLLDTMDHLLDWSKINNFVTSSKQRGSRERVGGSPRYLTRRNSIEAGMMSITSDIDVGVLAEEVVESICAGFNFQRFSLAELGGTEKSSQNKGSEGLRRLDTMQALENMITGKNKTGSLNIVLGNVIIGLDIDPEPSWIFRSQPGALRRIIMNILGNSLKYTSSGFIKICLSQDTSAPHATTRVIQLTVVDSGQGISEDYMQNRLFSPFSQEDSLAAGAGLGLSLVKRITTSLGGSVHVQSQVGKGTSVSVKLPLPTVAASLAGIDPDHDGMDEFEAQVSELQGLRVRLVGFGATYGVEGGRKGARDVHFSQQELLLKICRGWLKLHVIEPGQERELLPDFVMCDEAHLNHAFRARGSNASVPVIVICSDPLVARRLSTSPAFHVKMGVLEFISQPVGPRKLAKVLLLSFRRWTSSHSGKANSSTLSDGSSERMPFGMPGTPDLPGSDLEAPSRIETPPGPRTPQLDEPATQSEQRPGPSQADIKSRGEAVEMNLPVRPVVDVPTTPGPQKENEASPPAEGANFLLVDDNPVNLKMISHHMRKLGHRFDTASDGKQAYEAVKASEGRYKCVFMDISMPVMDGFESTRLIRAFEKEKHLSRSHIFALTGIASEAAQQEAFASGIDLFLTKPVKLKELNKILEEKKLGLLAQL